MGKITYDEVVDEENVQDTPTAAISALLLPQHETYQ